MKKRSSGAAKTLLTGIILANMGGLPVCASTEVFTGGQNGFGAQINDLGGANINYNTGTQAQIGITGNGNVIKWDHLNVGAGNKLDYNFTQSGQVALNKVINGVSKFAGEVSTSGANGHLVISNLNGMVFMNGSMVNANAGSATFTTHDVDWDGQLYGNISTNAVSKNGITVGSGDANKPVPVLKVAEDLYLIAQGIDVTGADLFAGGKVRMVSDDGVNFYAFEGDSLSPSGTTSTQANEVKFARVDSNNNLSTTSGNTDAIKIKNTSVRATQAYGTEDGRIYLAADGNISLENFKSGQFDARTNQNLAMINSTIKSAERGFVFTRGDLKITNSRVNGIDTYILGNAEINAESDIKSAEIQANGDVTVSGNSKVTTVGLSGKNVIIDNSTGQDINIGSYNDIQISGNSNINASNIYAGNNVNVHDSNVYDTYVYATRDIDARNSNIRSPYIYSGKNLSLDKVSLMNSSGYVGNDLNMKDSGYGFGQLYVTNNFTANNSGVNDANITGGKTGNIVNCGISNGASITMQNISIKDSNLKNANIYGEKSNKIDNSKIDGSLIYGTTGTVDVTNSIVNNGSVLRAKTDLNAGNTQVDNSMLHSETGNVNASNVQMQYGSVVANKGDFNVSTWSMLAGVNAETGGDINVNPGTGIYGSTFNAGKNITIDQSYAHSLNATANNGTIMLHGINAEGNGVKNFDGKNIIIQGGIMDGIVAKATDNLNIVGAGIYNGSTLESKNNINVTYGANIQNAKMNASNNIDIDGSTCTLYLNNVVANTANGDIKINSTGTPDGLGIDNTVFNSGRDIIVDNGNWGTKLQNSTTNAKGEIKLNGTTVLGDLKTNAEKGITGNNLRGNGTVIANKDSSYKDTVLNNLDILNSSVNVDLGSVNSINSVNISTTGDVSAIGQKIVGGLNIEKANNVTLKNSNEQGQYNFDKNPMTTTKNATDNGHIAEDGAPTIIDGDLKVANVNNLNIINTHVNGNLEVKDTNNTSIIHSRIENGDRDTILGFANNVYKSYIGGWTQEKIEDIYNNAQFGSITPTDDMKTHVGNDRLQKIHEDIDTIFRKQFTPRSFAATDDEIKAMKQETILGSEFKEGNSINLTKEFRAY